MSVTHPAVEQFRWQLRGRVIEPGDPGAYPGFLEDDGQARSLRSIPMRPELGSQR